MASSTAATVDQYLDELPEDRRAAMEAVRGVIIDHLPAGVVETMNWGMICYEIPLETFADTYNGQPLQYAALANQKRHMAVYLNGVYSSDEAADWFRQRWEATGSRLDMGKSCVRFTRLEEVPLEIIGEAIARQTVEQYLTTYRAARG